MPRLRPESRIISTPTRIELDSGTAMIFPSRSRKTALTPRSMLVRTPAGVISEETNTPRLGTPDLEHPSKTDIAFVSQRRGTGDVMVSPRRSGRLRLQEVPPIIKEIEVPLKSGEAKPDAKPLFAFTLPDETGFAVVNNGVGSVAIFRDGNRILLSAMGPGVDNLIYKTPDVYGAAHYTVGFNEGNDIGFTSENAPQTTTLIDVVDGTVIVQDLGSENGTRVRGSTYWDIK